MQADSRTRKQYMDILTILSTREPSARQMTVPKLYKAAAELMDDKSSIRTKRKKTKKNSITIAISAASQNLNSGSVIILPTKVQSRQHPN
jgi:hypothetical protein